MYRSVSYVFGLGALLMLVACGDGEKKSETKEQKANSATETVAEDAGKVSAESNDEKKGLSANEVSKESVSTTKSEENVVAETPQPVKSSKAKDSRGVTRETDSLVDIIESPIDDIVTDETVIAEENPDDQVQDVVEKKDESQSRAVAKEEEDLTDQVQNVEEDQPKIGVEEHVSESATNVDQHAADSVPAYELGEKSETVESPEVPTDDINAVNSEVPEAPEEVVEGEVSNARSKTNEEEDFIM